MISSDFKITSAGFTHVGHRRTVNEDHFLCHNELRLYAIADGLGGLPGGRLASKEAIIHLEKFFTSSGESGFTPTPENWDLLWEDLNHHLEALSSDNGYEHLIGTTLSLLYLDGPTAWWSHLGDSRIYHFRAGEMQQLTQDHTLLDLYQRDPLHPDVRNASPSRLRHTLTRCLGNQDDEPIPFGSVQVEPGDRFLLCSDGVWDALSLSILTDILADSTTPSRAASLLEERSLLLGGDDNLAAVVVFTK